MQQLRQRIRHFNLCSADVGNVGLQTANTSTKEEVKALNCTAN
jgi:hypothetical protein